MRTNELSLPPASMRFMAEDDEKFLAIARINVSLLQKYGLKKNDRLFDLGCGYGRLVYGLEEVLSFDGQYVGVDVLLKHIEWCQENIQYRTKNYQFHHLDIQNDRYNKNGKISAESGLTDFQLGKFDYVSLFSVFTHMYEEEIRNYLSIIHRALVVGGRCFCTFFLYDEERLPQVTSPQQRLRMNHILNDHTRYHNPQDKLHAIAFEKSFIKNLVEEMGFDCVVLNYGYWAGGAESFQDYLVLEKT